MRRRLPAQLLLDGFEHFDDAAQRGLRDDHVLAALADANTPQVVVRPEIERGPAGPEVKLVHDASFFCAAATTAAYFSAGTSEMRDVPPTSTTIARIASMPCFSDTFFSSSRTSSIV